MMKHCKKKIGFNPYCQSPNLSPTWRVGGNVFQQKWVWPGYLLPSFPLVLLGGNEAPVLCGGEEAELLENRSVLQLQDRRRVTRLFSPGCSQQEAARAGVRY